LKGFLGMNDNENLYSAQFKFKVASEAIAKHKTIDQIALEYGITPSLVTEWEKILLDNADFIFPSEDEETSEEDKKHAEYQRKINE
jgi:transposase-like protein